MKQGGVIMMKSTTPYLMLSFLIAVLSGTRVEAGMVVNPTSYDMLNGESASFNYWGSAAGE